MIEMLQNNGRGREYRGNNIGHVLIVYWILVHREFIIFTPLPVCVLGRKSKQQLNTHGIDYRQFHKAQHLPCTIEQGRKCLHF